MKKRWIREAIKNPGSLRRTLQIKKGEKIPKRILLKESKRKGITGRRARLALTLRGLRKR